MVHRIGLKRCAKCCEELPTDMFHKRTGAKDGLHSYCKPCGRAYGKANVHKYHGRYNARLAEAHLLRKYDLTTAQRDAMLVAQGGVCAICGTDNPRGTGRFNVDHDHQTGAVRALLCLPCNSGLGHFRDNPDILVAAAVYLTIQRNAD